MDLWRRYREAYRLAGRYEAAAESERKVAATLLTLTGRGWRLLVDRRWPGTRSANVDMILIGPGGVFVIDVKKWRHPPEVVDGHLTAGGESRGAEVDKLLAMTRTAERHLASLGMSPIALRPVMIFAGHRLDETLGRVRLLGDQQAAPALIAEPARLTAPMVRAVTSHLEEVFPAYESPVLGEGDRDDTPPAEADPLFDREEIERAALRAVLDAPIERWMTFLHPEQVALARRNWNGPARVSGPAGTGKTVVGLHRAAYLAQHGTGRILYVTYARNLPRVQKQLFQRLSPATADRVEFVSLHAWAQALLAERGVPSALNRKGAETAFSIAWLRTGRDSPLAEVDPLPGYWQDEIDYIIKGRGIGSLEEYRTVLRHGRRTALHAAQREAAWLLYEEYELIRGERGVHDFNDVLSMALRELRARPADPPYTAVIVDEVQDLTLVGLRLLHTLVGDAPNGLLLIGDGQQAVYPGGFRLSDAGITVTGRGGVLRTNYRNASEIFDAAVEIVSADPFDDLEESRPNGRREVETTYHDGRVIRAQAQDDVEHDRLLVEALRRLPGQVPGDGGGPLSGAAVLCPAIRDVQHYHRLLTRAGIPVLRLEDYTGHPVNAVKLGTYRRAKGLEFKYVFLPHHDALTRALDGGNAADRERSEILRRQLFVAMTRARDVLWLGSVAGNRGD
ncbi:nuclease-related domain-containing DEAD/DEAH box helicase [Sphaerisporangium fuscum]|uniref:nuclease-related domain-containing DEAD/DEAH box helicase n=1 Tax=Sphaerisporangium fuscum TaxID=2835868 RepID=UPI002029AAC5|nr:UvrD-helicase domain-containing protein [Sphaerisporangium fuscum]